MKSLSYFVGTSFAALVIYTLSLNVAFATDKIDVLFLYSQAVAEHYNGDASTRINHIIETSNAIYQSSNLDIEINAAEIQQYTIDDTIDAHTLMASAKDSQEIATLRDNSGADLVVIYRMYQSGQPCGLGYRPATLDGKWTGLSYVAINCAAYKTAHEIGHNMGLGHSYAQGSAPFLNYARGHGVDEKFATIMAYGSTYHAPKIYKFSSPDSLCNGISCGIPEGQEQEADAVKALRQTAKIVANLRDKKTGQCDNEQNATYSAIQTTYQNQKNKLAEVTQTLQILQRKKISAIAAYKKVMVGYEALIVKQYLPAYRLYQSSKDAYVQQLAIYQQGNLSRDRIISIYLQYKDARTQFIATQEQVKNFHKNQYLIAYQAMLKANTDIANTQKVYQEDQARMAQLEIEYTEAKEIYQCA